MAASVSSSTTEEVLRQWLEDNRYLLNAPRGHGETGVDIHAVRGKERLHIEVIGYKKSGPARAKDFFEVFFRAVSRLNDGAKKCVIALPREFSRGLPQRVKQHSEAWERIGDAFPELLIWLVDTEASSVSKTRWRDWTAECAPSGPEEMPERK